MPPKGKQVGVQEGSLLQLLRSAGFQAELPPSTVAWLENAPVFKFLSSKLSQDNFVAPGDQQEYTEIMMAKGPNADLYDALGSGSDDDTDDGQLQDQKGKDEQWMGAASDVDIQRQVEVGITTAAATASWLLPAWIYAHRLAAFCCLCSYASKRARVIPIGHHYRWLRLFRCRLRHGEASTSLCHCC
jgi:hypothetical protein